MKIVVSELFELNIIFNINTLHIQTLPTSSSVFFLSPPCSKPERRPLSAFTEIRIRSDPYESPSVGSPLQYSLLAKKLPANAELFTAAISLIPRIS